MSKRNFSQVDLSHLGEAPTLLRNFDWNLCFLCQFENGQALIQPAAAGYKSLSENLLQFDAIGALPSTFRLPDLNDGSGLEETLKKKNGKYHKNCRCTYDGQKLKRPRNRLHPSTVDDNNNSVCGRSRRSNLGCFVDIKNVCLFCNASEGATKEKLTQARTIEVGKNIMSHAIVLNDAQLIAKLSTDDLIALEANKISSKLLCEIPHSFS